MYVCNFVCSSGLGLISFSFFLLFRFFPLSFAPHFVSTRTVPQQMCYGLIYVYRFILVNANTNYYYYYSETCTGFCGGAGVSYACPEISSLHVEYVVDVLGLWGTTAKSFLSLHSTIAACTQPLFSIGFLERLCAASHNYIPFSAKDLFKVVLCALNVLIEVDMVKGRCN